MGLDVDTDVEQGAAKARRILEKKHAEANAQRAVDLAESRDRLTTAVSSAQEALLALIDATAAHSNAIRHHAAELAAQGFLSIVERCGVGSDLKAGVVVLSGETARVLDPAIVLRHVVERVQYARLQPREYHRVHQQGRGRIDNAASAAVIALVDPPALVTGAA